MVVVLLPCLHLYFLFVGYVYIYIYYWLFLYVCVYFFVYFPCIIIAYHYLSKCLFVPFLLCLLCVLFRVGRVSARLLSYRFEQVAQEKLDESAVGNPSG